LIVLREPEAAADETRSKLRAAASRKQLALDPRRLIAAGFVILALTHPLIS